MTEVEKKGIGKTKVGLITSVALVVILAISNVWFYTSLQNQLQKQQQQYNMLNTNFQNLQQDYDTLSTNYDDLQDGYDTLYTQYDALYTEYTSLIEQLIELNTTLIEQLNSLATEYQGALKVPYTTIVGGNVTWVFRTLDESIESWFMPIETYNYYVNNPKPTEYHYLTTDGQSFTIRNMELFVQSEFFSNVISSLTDGNTARDFVEEVFNLRVQLTLYSEDITDTPQWSAETMTRGAGDCEDFAILMASLLLAGNEDAYYGMTVQMVYMDAYNPTNPQTVNHVTLYVTYEDGTSQFVDSTSTDVLSPWSRVVGWYYDL